MNSLSQRLIQAAQSKVGLLLLGFLLTTGVGTFLNMEIQERSALNQRISQLEQERFRQAQQVQMEIIDSSNARVFALSQMVGQIAHPEDWSVKYNENYWFEHVEPAKNLWNKRRYYFHAQVRALFSPKIASLVYQAEEDATKAHDEDQEAMGLEAFTRSKPKSLHGAIKQLHANVYRLKQKCKQDPKGCDNRALIALIDAQTEHAELLQRCILYRFSAELLRFPVESMKASRAALGDAPPECERI